MLVQEGDWSVRLRLRVVVFAELENDYVYSHGHWTFPSGRMMPDVSGLRHALRSLPRAPRVVLCTKE